MFNVVLRAQLGGKLAHLCFRKLGKKGMYASRLEFAKDLLSEGESIERTVRLSKLLEAEVRELASKLSA